MAFNNWPYTNFQDLNLGWILGKLGVVERLAIDSAASVSQYDSRITANENAIEQLGIELDTISDVAKVFVNNNLEAYYRGEHITGSELLYVFQSHGTLPFVDYNGEVYMLDTVSNAGDMRFSMGHTVDAFNELVIRHIMIPAQSYNAAYSITNVSAGGGGSSGNIFAVKITPNTSTGEGYICDHTYAEIYSQMQNDRIPILLVSQGSNPTTFEICGMGETGTRTINGQNVACIRFADPTWLVNSSNNVGVWTIDANGNVDHIAALKQMATLNNIVQMVNDGVSTNALLKTAQTLTGAEQAQVKQNLNITDGGGMFVIPVTSSSSGGVTTYSTTATYAEIMAHKPNLIVKYGNLYYTLSHSATSDPNSWYMFVFSAQEPNNVELDTEWLYVNCENNAVTITAASLDIKGLPSTANASADDFLMLDSNKNPAWVAVPNAAYVSFGGV